MATKIISTYIASGFYLTSKFSSLTITSTGGVGGKGISTQAGASIVNNGVVSASGSYTGIQMAAGGSVLNGQGASITGGWDGVFLTGDSKMFNDGVVVGKGLDGVVMAGGDGYVVNGSTILIGASIIGADDGVVLQGAPGVIHNYGTIVGTSGYGVSLASGGSVFNGSPIDNTARIEGLGGFGGGISANVRSTVTNYGTIAAERFGIFFSEGGSVFNGSVGDQSALVSYGVQIYGGTGAVVNFGTISRSVGKAIALYGGGTVINGSASDTAALIDGPNGIALWAPSSVVNFGSVVGGIDLHGGGGVTNGANKDQVALIEGYTAIAVQSSGGSVTNFGVIDGEGAGYGEFGILFAAGGAVTNGGSNDQSALIEGYAGVSITGSPGAVANYGTIRGLGGGRGFAVDLGAGGTLVNGAGADQTALIEGGAGVLSTSAATVRNFGTILATGSGYGVELLGGNGLLANGSANNTAALIQGYSGLNLYTGSSTNFGTIVGAGINGFGVVFGGGATITNGSTGHAGALMEGETGVYAGKYTYGTLINFGTIEGAGGTAVRFAESTDMLEVEARSTFIGVVLGGGGTLDLASGVGIITGLLSARGSVTVSGSMAATTFQNFGTLEVGEGATFTDKGAIAVAGAETVNCAGTLTLGGSGKNIVNGGLIETTGTGVLAIAGAITNNGTLAAEGGTLTVNGAVTGAGGGAIDGGTLDLTSSFTEKVAFSGAKGVLKLAQSQGYTGTISGFSKSGKTSLDLADIGFVSSTEATFSGTTAGGVLTVSDGTHTATINLKGDYLSSTFVASSNGQGGVIIVDPTAPNTASAPPHRFIAAMAGHAGPAGGLVHTSDMAGMREPMLLAPRTMIA